MMTKLRLPHSLVLLAAALAPLALAAPVVAQGLTYVDADDGFVSGTPNLSPLSAVNSFDFNGTDNQWGFREFAAGGTIYETVNETIPELTQTISGLNSGSSYDVYVAYWTSVTEDWTIAGGLSPGEQIIYNNKGPNGTFPNGKAGVSASGAAWSVLPLDNPTASDDGKGIFLEGNRQMLLGNLGSATADSSGEIQVYINDPGGVTSGSRSWLDGVAYVEAGTPVLLSATIDRGTGLLTIDNPTSQDFKVASLSVTSAAGSLDATQWTSISDNFDGDSSPGGIDSDIWNITAPDSPSTTPFATELAEAEIPGDGGAVLVNGGGSFSLGDVWNQTPFEDVQVSLTLDDGLVIRPDLSYTGSAIVPGDLNGDGVIDIDGDYAALIANLHTDVSMLTAAEGYSRGNLTGNGVINYSDFAAFRAAYDNANGAGSFAAAVGVPEPTSLALLAMAVVGILVVGGRDRRWLTPIKSVPTQAVGLATAPLNNRTTEISLMSNLNRKSCFATLACAALVAFASIAQAAGVANWEIDQLNPGTNTPAITGANTNSPSLGDGSADNAVGASLFSSFPQVSLAVGEQVTLTGSTTLTGLTNATNDFRWGLFNEAGTPADSAGWTGFLATGIGGGTLYSKDPTAGDFETRTFASSGASVVLADTGVSFGDSLASDQYNFSMTVSRYETDQVGIKATLKTADGSYLKGIYAATESDPTRLSFDYNRVGLLVSGSMDADQVQFNNIDVSSGDISALTLQVNASGAMSIVNNEGSNFDISYYEVTSASGSLNFAGWTSLDDGEDSDPVGDGWEEAGGSNEFVLSEANLQGSTQLNANDSLSLGNAFGAGSAQDLQFLYELPDGTLDRGFVEYVTGGLTADLDSDSDVDGADFLAIQRTNPALISDFQAQYGTGVSATAAANAVPEPAAILVLGGLAGLWVGFRPRKLSRRESGCLLNRG